MTWRRRKPRECHGVLRVMTLHCDRCGDTSPLEANVVVLEAQVIVFVEAHSAHDGHAVRVRVRSRSLS